MCKMVEPRTNSSKTTRRRRPSLTSALRRPNNQRAKQVLLQSISEEQKEKAREAVRKFRARQKVNVEAAKKRIEVLKRRNDAMNKAMEMMDRDMVLIKQAIQMIKDSAKNGKKDTQLEGQEVMEIDAPIIDLTRMKDFRLKKKVGEDGSSQVSITTSSQESSSSSQRSQG